MTKTINLNHAQTRILSGILFFEKLHRDEILLKFQPECHVLKPELFRMTQKYSTVPKQARNRPDRTEIRPCVEKLSPKNLELSWKNLSRRLDLLLPILGVQSRTRTLCLSPAPPAHNASVSSCYPGLWDRFWSYFRPRSPYETLEIRTRARSLTLRSSPAVGFCHEFLSWMAENGCIGSLRPKSSPRVAETVQK